MESKDRKHKDRKSEKRKSKEKSKEKSKLQNPVENKAVEDETTKKVKTDPVFKTDNTAKENQTNEPKIDEN